MSDNPVNDPNVMELASKALGIEKEAETVVEPEEKAPEVEKKEEEVIVEVPEEKKEEEAKPEEEEKKDEELKDEKSEDGEDKEEEGEKKEEEKEEEEKPEEKKEDKKLDDRIASRFASLSRKEKAIRMREKELEAKVEKFKEVENLMELAKENPVAAIEKLGLTYEQLTSHVLKGDKPEIQKLSKLEHKVEQLEKEKEEFAEQDKQRRMDSAVDGFKGSIQEHLTANQEKYELINENPDAAEVLYEMIDMDYANKKATAEKEGYEISLDDAMTIEEAADMAEKILFDEVSKYSKAKKFAPKEPIKTEPTKAPEVKQKKVEEKKIVKPSAPKTLTNNLVTQSSPSEKPKTRQEDIDATAETFAGKLFDSE